MDILSVFSNPAFPEGNELIAARRYDAVYSDSTAERAGLAACLASLKRGDTLCLARETHLSEDFGQAVEVLGQLARRGVDVWLTKTDTLLRSADSPFPRLHAEAATAIVTFRRAFTMRKAREGWKRRVARGERVGRPSLPLPEGFEKAKAAWLEGRMTGLAAAASCGMAYSTFAKKARG